MEQNKLGKHSVVWTNDSTKLFFGFYESPLYNSDSELNMSRYLAEDQELNNKHYELTNFAKFQADTSKACAEHLIEQINTANERFNAPVLSEVEFVGIVSPREYNFATDSLRMRFTVDFDLLKKYCFYDHREEFDKYLHENYTSCDGFMSFIPNNVVEVGSKWLDNINEGEFDNLCTDVMIEFWLLQQIDVEQYQEDCVESSYDIMYENMELVDDEM